MTEVSNCHCRGSHSFTPWVPAFVVKTLFLPATGCPDWRPGIVCTGHHKEDEAQGARLLEAGVQAPQQANGEGHVLRLLALSVDSHWHAWPWQACRATWLLSPTSPPSGCGAHTQHGHCALRLACNLHAVCHPCITPRRPATPVCTALHLDVFSMHQGRQRHPSPTCPARPNQHLLFHPLPPFPKHPASPLACPS